MQEYKNKQRMFSFRECPSTLLIVVVYVIQFHIHMQMFMGVFVGEFKCDTRDKIRREIFLNKFTFIQENNKNDTKFTINACRFYCCFLFCFMRTKYMTN